MKQYRTYGNYVTKPVTSLNKAIESINGWKGIAGLIMEEKDKGKRVFVMDLYPGVTEDYVIDGLSAFLPDAAFIRASDALYPYDKLDDIFRDYITDDRVFGYMTGKNIDACFDIEKLASLKEKAEEYDGIVIVCGTGASLITKGDVLFFFDISRWEIQLRYRKGLSNWLAYNQNAPQLTKYKRGFFIEWRIADKHKDLLWSSVSYMVDANDIACPKAVRMDEFRNAFREAASKPFRMEPYFDPGVWGGQWMRSVCSLPEGPANYAWSFDGVPEENSISFPASDGGTVSFPMMDMVLLEPEALLGKKNIARFGREFPIRFDFLDTMDGQNLSLQVHPLTEYIQKTFGMHYTQDESYYILDAEADACVYIGLKEGVDKDAMERDLRAAQKGEIVFDAEKYVNRIPVKKHDHILIPAGTVHCSGKNAMVLEISATPYIFTFKLWDWGRVGLDGLPRPIHIDHGMKNIQWNRTTGWVMENLVDNIHTVEESGDFRKEVTGLHELEFIETVRYTTSSSCDVEMNDSVQQLNLAEGEKAVIESTDGSFAPFEVHYAESFIIPSSVRKYRIRSCGGQIKVVAAFVRQ
ncbi:MAG: class I mannose-6-phosphate isomerase [Bullifex sp.]